MWPDSFVEQNNLAQNISALRKALGEGVEGIRYIDTVPKRGYRFIAPVSAYEVTIEHEIARAAGNTAGAGGGFGTSPGGGFGGGHGRTWWSPGDHAAAHALHGNSHGGSTAHTVRMARPSAARRGAHPAGAHGQSHHEQALHGASMLAAAGPRRRPRGSRAPRRSSTSPKRATRAAAT